MAATQATDPTPTIDPSSSPPMTTGSASTPIPRS